jgi:hypothetical protein
MDAFPCGSAWKWVIPALQPTYGLRVRGISRDWLGSTSSPPWMVGLMFVYSNDSMPNRSAIALIARASWALRFETTSNENVHLAANQPPLRQFAGRPFGGLQGAVRPGHWPQSRPSTWSAAVCR